MIGKGVPSDNLSTFTTMEAQKKRSVANSKYPRCGQDAQGSTTRISGTASSQRRFLARDSASLPRPTTTTTSATVMLTVNCNVDSNHSGVLAPEITPFGRKTAGYPNQQRKGHFALSDSQRGLA
mmetsp:Transcript_8556/g.20407  ORF Transcript_8556/g.20407 Transcript_8556/m.20407 type:complete len:124 (-) Transcript_8556:82-453(-)